MEGSSLAAESAETLTSVLAGVDALANASRGLTSAATAWSAHVLPSHAKLASLIAQQEKREAAPAATAPSPSLLEAALPLGAAVHFVHATPAHVDRAAAGSASSVLAAATRLHLCDSLLSFIRANANAGEALLPLAKLAPPLLPARSRLLRRCHQLLADPTLGSEPLHAILASTSLK